MNAVYARDDACDGDGGSGDLLLMPVIHLLCSSVSLNEEVLYLV